MSRIDRKKIVNKLNIMINNYNELSAFCDELSNDINVVIEKISKVIKYAFVKKDFISNSESLYITLLELEGINDLDKMYKENLSRRLFLPIKRKNTSKNMFSLPLDDDIEVSDIEGLRLPIREELEQICKHNLEKAKAKEETRNRKENYYREQRGFDEIGFEYTRPELITIDSSFIYFNANLTGNISEDYRLMYNDDRYNNKTVASNPLNNDYYKNIEEIKKHTDISVRKLGNVYEIKNGRHRIMYILYNGKPAVIPAKVSRRIEDQEFNIIINNLKKNYHISIQKNNLLNDEPNIILIFNGMIYEIKNKVELISFYNNLTNGIDNAHFTHMPFTIINNINNSRIIYKYRELIFKKYLSMGEKILTSNFTDIIKHFNGDANSLFYEAFRTMQFDYQNSLIFNYDFNKLYESTVPVDLNETITYISDNKHIK